MHLAVEGPRVRAPFLWYWRVCGSRLGFQVILESYDRANRARLRLMQLLQENPGTGAPYRKSLAKIGVTPGGYEMHRTVDK